MAKEKQTLISDLPDYDDSDSESEILPTECKQNKSSSIMSELNESNLLILSIIFLILYKPSLDILNMIFTKIIPWDDLIVSNALKALLIIIMIIVIKRYIL
jgi:hypothetical protein